MKKAIAISAMAAAAGLALAAAPGTASASCADRRATGTVLGGIGGALIGNSISRGGGGAVIGGLGGAVLGHQIAASGCRSSYSSGRYRTSYSSSYRQPAPAQPRAVRYVYYDQYGNAVAQGPAPVGPTQAAYASAAYAPACRVEQRTYYDDRGMLARRAVQICDR